MLWVGYMVVARFAVWVFSGLMLVFMFIVNSVDLNLVLFTVV